MIVSAYRGDCGVLYDADGVEVVGAIEANLKTGDVTHVCYDAAGNAVVVGDEVATEIKAHPAPLTFIRREVPRTG